MTDENVSISNAQRFNTAVDELEELLREQLKLARQGDPTEVETLAERTGGLIERLSKSEFFREPLFEKRRRKLQELYEQVCLVLSAQMEEVSQSLGRIGKGKKTITLYRNNM
jgi:hypothetical protein